MLKTPWVSIIPFYDDRMAAIHLFKSLKEHNCPAIWCDGRFKEFQQINGSDLSTDGLRELIQAEDNMMLIDCPAQESHHKWTMMFKTAGDLGYKYCFLWGCDEVPVGSFEECIKGLAKHDPDSPRLFRLMMIEKGKQGFWKDYDGPKERLFFRPDLIEVRGSHWAFYDKSFIDGYPLLSPPEHEKGLIFYHNNQVRTAERDEMMSNYQKMRVPGERQRTMDAIVETAHNKYLDINILKDLYPACQVLEGKTYEGRQFFKIQGKADPNILRKEYQSYVIIPLDDGGLYIRKAVINPPNRFGTNINPIEVKQ